MPLRLPFALIAILVGVAGLALNMSVFVSTMGPPENRSFLAFIVYFWSFLTNVSNTVLLLIYAADLSGARGLGWFRDPVTKAGMGGIMLLVMFFYHFMLAPVLPELPQAIVIANVLLHYITPVMFLAWWAVWSPHGSLRYRDVPLMLVPGLIYVIYIQIRGLLAGEYPYTILDPGFAPAGTAVGPVGVAISVGILVLAVALADIVLVTIDRLLARQARR